MRMNELQPAVGSHKAKRRVGRGPGSGLGKAAARGQEGILDPAMDRHLAAFKPATAIDRELRGLGDLFQSHEIDPEAPRMRFTAMRHGQLDMVDAQHAGHTRSACAIESLARSALRMRVRCGTSCTSRSIS